jgi:hypothetical protein
MQVPDASIGLNQKRFKADSSGDATIFLQPGRYLLGISSVNHFTYNLSFTAE